MDFVEHFSREAAAFEVAGRAAAGLDAAPAVPSCPDWVMTDLVLHLGMVHRFVARVIAERMQQPPDTQDSSWLGLRDEWAAWPPPSHAPRSAALPAELIDWFHAGAAALAEQFRAVDPGEQVWTWWTDQTAGFWHRMQAIEVAVHRWDAENAVGTPGPIDEALAADAIGQTFEIMAPMRRTLAKAPPGHGERFLFQRTDGPQTWAVRFDGDAIVLNAAGGDYDIEISGVASDLALFLWQRPVAGKLAVKGDTSMLTRYFDLVPPV